MTAIKHIHLENCLSTQDEMKQYLNKNSNEESIAISTARQDDGRGRRDNKWLKIGEQIALSLSIKAHSTLTLTPLEIALLVSEFFSKEYHVDLNLKWPNDLLNSQGEKIGGILCEVHKNIVIAGIGVNLSGEDVDSSFDYPMGYIFNKNYEKSIQELNQKLAQFIIDNRINSSEQLISKWNEKCLHLNKEVIILDNEKEVCGTFVGIGKNGEALVAVDGKQQAVFTGSLRFNR